MKRVSSPSIRTERLVAKGRYGGFDKDRREYRITRPDTPREWYNYLWNESYVSLFSQTGQGESLAQDTMGRRIAAVAGRMLFLRDESTGCFSILNGLPVDAPRNGYRCRHGLGYSVIEQEAMGIESTFRCFVPLAESCEIWTCTLKNTGKTTRRLVLFSYCGTTYDGVFRPQTYYPAVGSYDRRRQAVILANPKHRFGEADGTMVYMTSSARPAHYGTTMSGFIGYGTEHRPAVVVRGHCRDDAVIMEKSCLALEIPVTLKAGASITLHIAVGTGTERSQMDGVRRLFRPGAVERELERVRARIDEHIGTVRINTPDKRFDAFFDPWLKRQVSLGIQWARVRHNGFRDQMQDMWGMTLLDPEEAGRQLARVLSYQYSNGYAPRTWIDGKIMDRDFSDNHVWIAYAVFQLIMETGDRSLLDTIIPFNDGTRASLYEHVKRAVGYYWTDRGLHGLLRIRSGDWNDCLDAVGPKGRGVSVWLSMAWVLASEQFAELADLAGRRRDAVTARKRAAIMRRLINRVAWDGEWYVRAFNDKGGVLGSKTNRVGTLFLLPQAWAVIAGIADKTRERKAMDAVDRHLESDLGTVKSLHPYDRWDPAIGYSSVKVPGVHENGGVYLHANCFKMLADCLMRRRDKVARALATMLPFDQRSWPKNGEPFVFSNSYFATPGNYRYGTSGQSWGTGTAAWFAVVMVQHVFGLQPSLEGLRIQPCLPRDWRRCGIHRRFRGADYDITFRQGRGDGTVNRIIVDGRVLDGNRLPWQSGHRYTVMVELN